MSNEIINGLVNIKVTINITNNCNMQLKIDTLFNSH